MKTIRKISTNPLILAFIIFSILFTSCSPNELDNRTNDFSAEDIFRGVIFFEGDVAEAVPYINQNLNTKLSFSKEERASYLEYQNEMIEYLKGKDPSFLEEFKREVQSKDVYRINKVLKKATGYNLEYVQTLIPDEIPGEKLNSLDFTHLKEQLDKEGVDGFKRQLKNQLGYSAKDDTCLVCLAVVIAVIAVVAIYYYYQVYYEVSREREILDKKGDENIILFTKQELLISISENL